MIGPKEARRIFAMIRKEARRIQQDGEWAELRTRAEAEGGARAHWCRLLLIYPRSEWVTTDQGEFPKTQPWIFGRDRRPTEMERFEYVQRINEKVQRLDLLAVYDVELDVFLVWYGDPDEYDDFHCRGI